jgi:iron complex outermembrane recepter protein
MTRSRRRKLVRAGDKPRAPVAKGIGSGIRQSIRHHIRRGIPLASWLLVSLPAAHAQEAGPGGAAPAGGLQEVVVTAQKRTENLQDVPVSIQTLSNEKLDELNITDMDDYVKYLSGVTTVKGLGQGGTGVGTTHVYMRGVVSGQDGNHSGSQPTVGTYLDEQPVTTIDGTVDIHIYDIDRIEVLEGPQGTLYGASSEAGTIRIITNKPDPTKFAAGYDFSGNSVDHGGLGWTGEGFVNIPLASWAAVRLVGWDEHDAGYIHNIAGTDASAGIVNGNREFPVGTGCPCTVSTGFEGPAGTGISNVNTTNSQYNTAENRGGRAALRINLGDDWTITPQFMGQVTNTNGFFGYDPAMGDLDVARFGTPDSFRDSWTQSSLTVTGKISNFDLTYAGGYFVRNEHTLSDYSDYTYFYDKYFASGCNWVTQAGYNYLQSHPKALGNCYGGTPYPAGDFAEPQEYVITNGKYTKWANEIRLTTPQDLPVKGLVGLFAQRQVHEIWEQYTIPGAGGNPYTYNPQGLAQSLTIPGVPGNTIWLTDQERVDRDQAAFGQLTWDINQSWQVIGGIRFYHYDNSLEGFYGYSGAYQDQTGFYPGQNICIPGAPAPFHGAPCTDLNQTVGDNGKTYRGTITYKFDTERLLYATYSTGYRPGGVNRVYDPAIKAVFPPYQADYLHNYEIGWKTEWDHHRLRWNGALFWENWDNFQFLYLGPNSVTVVQNAASATIKGVESNLQWAATRSLLLSADITYLHAVTTANYCGPQATIPGTTTQSTTCPDQINGYRDTAASGFSEPSIVAPPGPEAPEGTELPVAPRFKGNLIARYTFPLGDWDAHAQAAYVYQSSSEPLLRLVDQQDLGQLPAYGTLDLSTGGVRNGLSLEFMVTNVFDTRGELTRFVECATTTCTQPYVIPTQPRTFFLKFGQRF